MTPAHLSALQAFRKITEDEGKDEAYAVLMEIGDALSLWPVTPVFADLDQRAAQALAQVAGSVRPEQRRELLEAMAGHVRAGLEVVGTVQWRAA